MNLVRGASLMAATMSTGFVAAVFVFYSSTIMPGLAAAGDRTFVGGFGAIEIAIYNPLFMGVGFFGAALLMAFAGIVHRRGSVRPWIAAAFVLYMVAFVVTIAVHLPLNDVIRAAGAPDRIADVASVRERFDESTWQAWNHVRSVVGVVAFGCLTWALVLFGRTTPPATRPVATTDPGARWTDQPAPGSM